jgi:hypothetical protein
VASVVTNAVAISPVVSPQTTQRQRNLGFPAESWMAAGEEQEKAVIRLERRLLLVERGQLGMVPPVSIDPVESKSPGDGRKPRARPLRNPLRRPALERDQQGILDRLLDQREVADPAHQRRGEPARLLPEHRRQSGPRLVDGKVQARLSAS